ncbi:hypothetical protein SH668x_002015 [Planctomicrobium sp. SH668]|uniref:hypothetical protein n=1 Tax=Planctomicrobium sp. SH668 TaxID=3448126 RepID=UPI003F5BEE06
MNKAFVREPDDDGRAFCPRCGSLGTSVIAATLDAHIQTEFRMKIGGTGWYCQYPPCSIAYFDQLGGLTTTEELNGPVYPKSTSAPICACFQFDLSEIEEDILDGSPSRIRELLKKSESEAANCGRLAADGRCCITEVKRIYIRLKEQRNQM